MCPRLTRKPGVGAGTKEMTLFCWQADCTPPVLAPCTYSRTIQISPSRSLCTGDAHNTKTRRECPSKYKEGDGKLLARMKEKDERRRGKPREERREKEKETRRTKCKKKESDTFVWEVFNEPKTTLMSYGQKDFYFLFTGFPARERFIFLWWHFICISVIWEKISGFGHFSS